MGRRQHVSSRAVKTSSEEYEKGEANDLNTGIQCPFLCTTVEHLLIIWDKACYCI